MAVRTINRSLRFNDDDSAHLTRTPGSAGNRKTWTWSGWVKRANLGSDTTIFSAKNNASDTCAIRFLTTDAIRFFVRLNAATDAYIDTTQVFRDPAAWYHLVFVHDTTNATATDRLQIWVNGVRAAVTATGTAPLNGDGNVNDTIVHHIGAWTSGPSWYLDGYMAEVHFLDGTALTAADFGEIDADGVWQPKVTSFTSSQYGLNGFYLNFNDNTSTTTLGNDVAPTGTGHASSNNWTLNNFSVAAGAGNDSLLDTPTVNYCTWNRVIRSSATFNNGNLSATSMPTNRTGPVAGTVFAPIDTAAGFYFEAVPDATGGGFVVGIIQAGVEAYDSNPSIAGQIIGLATDGTLYYAGSNVGSFTGYVAGDTLQFWFSNGNLFIGKNGTPMNSGNAVRTGLTGFWTAYANHVASSGSGGITANFGQRPFAYTPPGGFVALNTANLPTPTIINPEQHFNVKLYTGTAAVADLTDFGYTPDLVWIKNRTSSSDHVIIDSTRTRNGLYPYLSSNTTGKEQLVVGNTHIDQSPDTPTVNYPVINPHATTGNTSTVIADGNLQVTDVSGSATWKTRFASYSMPTGKWYAEFLVNYTGTGSFTGTPGSMIGLHNGGDDSYIGASTATFGYAANGLKYNTSGVSFGATYANGDVISVAYDADTGRVWFALNGVWQASGNPAAGTNAAFTSVPAGLLFGASTYWVSPDGNTHILCNFGARPFFYTPPTGFLSLNDSTTSDPVIKLPKQHFNMRLFTGTGTAGEYTDLGFTPDLAWIKSRSATGDHFIFDSVRTAGNRISCYLSSNATAAQRVYASTPNYDDLIDVPGNATDNFSSLSGDTNLALTYSNTYATPTVNTGWSSRQGMTPFSSGKWYAEFSVHGITAGAQGTPFIIGIIPIGNPFTANAQQLGASGRGYGFGLSDTTGNNILRFTNGSNSSIGQGYVTAAGDVFMMAIDLDTGQMWVGKNGGWLGGDPASGTGAHLTGVPAGTYLMGLSIYRDATYVGNIMSANYGHSQFNFAPPAGFRPLTSHNLPALPNSRLHMRGNAPDLVWLKSRSAATDHMLVDRVRGMSINLSSNTTAAEYAAASVMEMTKFGIRLSGNTNVNTGGATYVAYAWKEGVTPGFDIVTYTGNGTSLNVAHGLGVTPAMMIVKRNNSTGAWAVYHLGLSSPATGVVYLNTTDARTPTTGCWNSTPPTSSVFTVGNNTDTNTNLGTHVAYLFAEVPGFSRFGSYTGNGNASGPFIYCGFKPAFVMIKRTDSNAADADWRIVDSTRSPINPAAARVVANANSAETTSNLVDFVANGFKLRSTDANTNAATYIYAAFAEAPFQYANAE